MVEYQLVEALKLFDLSRQLDICVYLSVKNLGRANNTEIVESSGLSLLQVPSNISEVGVRLDVAVGVHEQLRPHLGV